MERLTQKDEYGNADIIAISDIMPEIYAGLSFSEANALTEALNRLASYEDTGLTPEEFHAYWVFFEDLIGNQKASEALDYFRQVLHAERDGRLVVLPDGDNAADVAPVRHGRWIDTEFYGPHHMMIVQCSACQKESEGSLTDAYCPNCGAKMDEEGTK